MLSLQGIIHNTSLRFFYFLIGYQYTYAHKYKHIDNAHAKQAWAPLILTKANQPC